MTPYRRGRYHRRRGRGNPIGSVCCFVVILVIIGFMEGGSTLSYLLPYLTPIIIALVAIAGVSVALTIARKNREAKMAGAALPAGEGPGAPVPAATAPAASTPGGVAPVSITSTRSPAAAPRYCSFCGAPLEQDARSCSNCGCET